jgi:hypothetical protein
VTSPGDNVPGHIPAAYRRTSVPRGATVRVRAKRDAPPPRLIVEASDGTDLLTITVTPDDKLDITYDPERLTEAARQLLVELRQILGLRITDPYIRVPISGSADHHVTITADPPPSRPQL